MVRVFWQNGSWIQIGHLNPEFYDPGRKILDSSVQTGSPKQNRSEGERFVRNTWLPQCRKRIRQLIPHIWNLSLIVFLGHIFAHGWASLSEMITGRQAMARHSLMTGGCNNFFILKSAWCVAGVTHKWNLLSVAFYVRNIVHLFWKRHQARSILWWYAGKYSNDIRLYDWNIESKSGKMF